MSRTTHQPRSLVPGKMFIILKEMFPHSIFEVFILPWCRRMTRWTSPEAITSFSTWMRLRMRRQSSGSAALRVFPCFFCFFFTFDESKLSDVVAVIGGVDDVGVFQLARFNQHVVDLRWKETPVWVHRSTAQTDGSRSESPSPRCRPQTAASAVVSFAAYWWTPCGWASLSLCSAWSSACPGLVRSYSSECWGHMRKKKRLFGWGRICCFISFPAVLVVKESIELLWSE